MSELDDLLRQLSVTQLKYLSERVLCDNDTEAAKRIGVDPNTIYRWPPIVQEALKLMHLDGVHLALELRRRALSKAMQIKVEGMDSKNERIRQAVCTEIIEWNLGKATQPTENKDEVKVKWDI